MEFETVDYTDEMVIVKNNENKINRRTKRNVKLKFTTHNYNVIYIYL